MTLPVIAREEPSDGAAPEAAEAAGEPVCLLHRVCPECGRLAEADAAATCAVCGTSLRD